MPTLTIAEVDRLPSDPTYEIVDGLVADLPPALIGEALIVSAISSAVGNHAYRLRLGRVVNHALFAIQSGTRLIRRPDIALVSYNRWPADRRIGSGNAWAVVPDLAIEVVSPGNYANELPERVAEYFSAGVRRVWVVYPTVRQVYLYDAPKSVRVVGPGDDLDGDEVIPGFRLAVDAMFEDLGEDEIAPHPGKDA